MRRFVYGFLLIDTTLEL